MANFVRFLSNKDTHVYINPDGVIAFEATYTGADIIAFGVACTGADIVTIYLFDGKEVRVKADLDHVETMLERASTHKRSAP